MERSRIVFSGSGGQGVITAATIPADFMDMTKKALELGIRLAQNR